MAARCKNTNIANGVTGVIVTVIVTDVDTDIERTLQYLLSYIVRDLDLSLMQPSRSAILYYYRGL